MSRLSSSGSFWMVVSCFSFSAMGVFVKLGSDTLSTAELMFYRASIALLVLLVVIVIPGRRSLKISAPVLRLYMGRSICGAISMMMGTYAMAHLPLPTAVTLQNTTPLFLMVLIALLHRLLPGPAQAASIALGFLGVILLLQPTLSSDLLFPSSMGLLSGLFSAGSMFNIRELGKAGITVNCVSPGYLETNMTDGITDSQLDSIRRRSPFDRFPSVEEVAKTVRFLVSPEGSGIHGANLVVDLGSTA